MRPLFGIVFILFLSACTAFNGSLFTGLPPATDIAMGAGAVGLMYGDDIANMSEEDISLKNATPPRAKSAVTRVANGIRDNVHATGKHLKDWWMYKPEELPPNVIPDSYCYRAQGDVLCYRAPVAGWEHRLVGYQGTFAAAPPPVVTRPLPAQSAAGQKTPASRVAASQPVFSELPPEPKAEPKINVEEPEATENVHENVTDPALAPQL